MPEEIEALIKRGQYAVEQMERLSTIAAQLAKETRKALGNLKPPASVPKPELAWPDLAK